MPKFDFRLRTACQNPFAPLSSVNVVEETFCIAGSDLMRRERRVPALALKIKSVTVQL